MSSSLASASASALSLSPTLLPSDDNHVEVWEEYKGHQEEFNCCWDWRKMPRDLPPELEQGVEQMGWLLAEHWQRTAVDPGAWWEVAMDVWEPLSGHPEVLAVVVAQMEMDLVGRIAEVVLEEEEE
ncbi:hypothetical protein E4T56_gene832 [Termitomyces sp. T112]|nr:hypothetical protein E4T56_gene832 [Termitomyces sp. T112]